MRHAVLLAFALATASGCVDAQVEDDPGPTAGPEAVRLPLTLSPCVIVEAIGTASEAKVRAHLPEAFAPILRDDGTVTVIFGMAQCAGGGAARSFVAMPVEPQDPRLMDANVSRHFFEPEHAVLLGDGFAEALEMARADPTRLSAFTLEATTATVTGHVAAEDFDHAMEAVGPSTSPYDTRATTFREWFPGHDGFSYLDGHFGGGPGERSGTVAVRLTLGEGTIARDLLGADPVLPAVRLDPGHYNDAYVGFVPYPETAAS